MGISTIHGNSDLILLGAILPDLMKPFKSNVIHLKNHTMASTIGEDAIIHDLWTF